MNNIIDDRLDISVYTKDDKVLHARILKGDLSIDDTALRFISLRDGREYVIPTSNYAYHTAKEVRR